MTYHLIGLGGIGMSALARVLVQKGKSVQGSDLKPSALLEQLQAEGIGVHIGHKAESVQEAEIVVHSTDVKESNVELQEAKKRGLPLWHRSDLLHALMEEKKPLLVTGTHGKTTTTALLASVLVEAKLDPGFVIGGIHQAWKTNGRFGAGAYFVAEADESDGSFLKTAAFGAIVTNVENDHLDYWKTAEKLDAGFRQFVKQCKHPEHLFWCGDDVRLSALQPKGVSYGFGAQNALRIERFAPTEHGITFNLTLHGKRYEAIELSLYGRHNALNAAAVFGLALSLGISEAVIRSAFRSFAGTARRLEKKGSQHAVDLYDDYGHHPTEIRVTLAALRAKIREKRLVVVFQPHRYTRTRDLFAEFAHCFDEADILFVTDIFSAGEAPIAGIDAQSLCKQIPKAQYVPRNSLETTVAEKLRPHDVVLTIGAGDVTKAGEPILTAYKALSPRWKVAVVCGGTSAEHPVSLMSARNVVRSLNPALYDVELFAITKQGQWIHGPDAIERVGKVSSSEPIFSPTILQKLTSCDVVLPVLHGPQCEDGMTQGLFDALQIPYAGCDYRVGAMCMHKGWTKQVAMQIGIPTPPYVEFEALEYRKDPEAVRQRIELEISYPVWIKPVHLGSSLGITRVNKPEDLEKAIALALSLDDVVMAEKHVEGRPIEVALLGNEFIRTASPCEIMNEGQFYDYHKKYTPGACHTQVPANISAVEEQIVREMGSLLYQKLGCRGLARIDFFLDHNGHYWLNEINPMPGLTNTSAFPLMWEGSGVSRPEVSDQLVILAFHRSRKLEQIRGK